MNAVFIPNLVSLNLEQNLNQFNYWADKMELLPMYFMGFYGSVDVKTVIDVRQSAIVVWSGCTEWCGVDVLSGEEWMY